MNKLLSSKLLENCSGYLRIIPNKGKGKRRGLLKIYNLE